MVYGFRMCRVWDPVPKPKIFAVPIRNSVNRTIKLVGSQGFSTPKKKPSQNEDFSRRGARKRVPNPTFSGRPAKSF